ncbi:MAG: PD40 domain-containing protein [Acidobacteria bacterium]|nr:PD40 domain-containing protein [Acidobacteriota bacterium]
MKGKLYWTLTLIATLLTLPAHSWPAHRAGMTAQGDPALQSHFTTRAPTIDGQFRAGEWDEATVEPFTFFMIDFATGDDTRSIPADLYLMNDQKNLYLGLRVLGVPYNNPGIAGQGFDLIALLFDNNNNDTYGLGEDQKFLLTIQPNISYAQRGAYADLHVVPEDQDGADSHIDGLARIVHSNVHGTGDYTAEFALPLNSGDPFDIATMPDGRLRFNIFFITQLGAATEGGGIFGLEFQDSSGWGIIQLQLGQAPPDQEPSLSGTMAFITSEFKEGRQVFVMNADGTNVRTRTQGDRVVGAPVLSPDGQRIVYTAAEADRPDTQEIYSVSTSGGRARRLTSNNVPDSHPVISPNGRDIAFAREGNIWLMSATGGNEHQLTDSGMDSDPTWTPDGRIVFTTTRWGGAIEIAVMNADGSNITRITDNEKGNLSPRVSPDGQWVTFFRYDGPGPFYTFEVSLFHPWNIYRIRMNGTEEQRLTNDGLLNYLPAFSPDGRGILYQKILDVNSFYTVLHYLDLQTGESRRVLNLSRVETFDWR